MSITGTVYKITNRKSNFVYYGETVRDVRKRWNEHLSNKIKSAGWFFTTAMKEYYPNDWIFEIVETFTLSLPENIEDIVKTKCYMKKLLREKENELIRNCDHQKCYNTQLIDQKICQNCDFISGTELGLKIHIFQFHNGEKWTDCEKCIIQGPWCEKCWEKFQIIFFRYICNKCKSPKYFFFKEGYAKHKEIYHCKKIQQSQIDNYKNFCENISEKVFQQKKIRNFYSELWRECSFNVACKVKPRIINGILYC